MKPDQYRPRTKHIGIKYHPFRDCITNGEIIVEKVESSMNWADILTKPLPKPQFEFLRNMIMGWL